MTPNEEQNEATAVEQLQEMALQEMATLMVAIMTKLGLTNCEVPLAFENKTFVVYIHDASTVRTTLNEYQQLALRTLASPGANHSFAPRLPEGAQTNDEKLEQFDSTLDLLHAAMGMAGEAGEFLDLVKKSIFYGKPVDKKKLVEEAGDVLWYIAAPLGRALGVPLEAVAMLNFQKLRTRYPERYTDEAAIARVDTKQEGTPSNGS